MSSEWYYRKSGQQYGPVSPQQLKQLAQSGEIQPTDFVRKDENAGWASAKSVKGLFADSGRPSPPITEASPVDSSIPPIATGAATSQVRGHPKKKSPVFWIAVIGGGGFLSLMLCCGGFTIIGMFMQREARREIERADALYEKGEQAEAVNIYKENVNLAGRDKDRMYQRIVQFEISNGNQVGAEKWLRKSIKNDVTIEAEAGTELAILIAKVQTEIEEEKQRQAEEERSQAELARRQKNSQLSWTHGSAIPRDEILEKAERQGWQFGDEVPSTNFSPALPAKPTVVGFWNLNEGKTMLAMNNAIITGPADNPVAITVQMSGTDGTREAKATNAVIEFLRIVCPEIEKDELLKWIIKQMANVYENGSSKTLQKRKMSFVLVRVPAFHTPGKHELAIICTKDSSGINSSHEVEKLKIHGASMRKIFNR